jgi:hypothetical protein
MSTVDDLLARSLLHQPEVPSDVVPHDDQAADGLPPWGGYWPGAADDSTAQSLTALCEAVVTYCTADELADFLTDQVPEPRTARILGCALHLAGADTGARFWWQYAAGADDGPSSYCLYLHHLAAGDPHAAALWQAQASAYAPPQDTTDPDQDSPAHRMMTADTSMATVLRILSHLSPTTSRRHTPTAHAVIQFVARAVTAGYRHHPDLEIPLPGMQFAEQLGHVVASAADRPKDACPPAEDGPADELPDRLTANTPAKLPPARWATTDPEDLLVKVTSPSREPASARRLFEAAAAICWQTATITDGASSRDNHLAYYRLRRYARARLAPLRLTSTTTPPQPGTACTYHR